MWFCTNIDTSTSIRKRTNGVCTINVVSSWRTEKKKTYIDKENIWNKSNFESQKVRNLMKISFWIVLRAKKKK